jgi:hypothetical protein
MERAGHGSGSALDARCALTLEEWQRAVDTDGRTGSVILARSQSVSVALAGAGAPHLAGEAIDRAINRRSHQRPDPTEDRDSDLPRKEVIQPHLPVRLPCYDFVPITDPTFDGCLLAVGAPASGVASFHDVTGGVYKAREHIHRRMLTGGY